MGVFFSCCMILYVYIFFTVVHVMRRHLPNVSKLKVSHYQKDILMINGKLVHKNCHKMQFFPLFSIPSSEGHYNYMYMYSTLHPVGHLGQLEMGTKQEFICISQMVQNMRSNLGFTAYHFSC